MHVVGVLKPSDPRPIGLWTALLLWTLGVTIPAVFLGSGFAEKCVPFVFKAEGWRRIDSRVPGVEIGLFLKTIGTRVAMPDAMPDHGDVPVERVELWIERPPTPGKLVVNRGGLEASAVSDWLASKGFAGPQAAAVAGVVVKATDEMQTPAGDRDREFASVSGGPADIFAERPFPFRTWHRDRAGTVTLHVLAVVLSVAIWLGGFWLARNWRRLTAPTSATAPAPR